jgi:hypothetical protein
MVPRHGNGGVAGGQRYELVTECNCRSDDHVGADFSTAKQPQALCFGHDPELSAIDTLPRWRVQRQCFDETAPFPNYFKRKSLSKFYSKKLVKTRVLYTSTRGRN